MALRDWTGGQRLLGAWLVVALVGLAGWFAAGPLADRYVRGLDREVVCVNTGVALGDTVLRDVERARRDSAELAERNCAARYELARGGRENAIRIPLALAVLASALVLTLVSLAWAARGAWRRLRR